MGKENGSQSIVTIFLVVLVLVFASLSGYLYLQKGTITVDESKDDKIAELTTKLRGSRYESSVKNTGVTKVDAANKKVTILDIAKKEVTLSVVDSSDVKKVVLSNDKKFKNLEDASLSDIKVGNKVSVIYNGNDEVVYLAVE
jgi:Cu/Ag efflux protein CusF